MQPADKPGGNRLGFAGALALGIVCVACCFAPLLAIGGTVVGIIVATTGWLVGAPLLLAAGLVILLSLAVAVYQRRPQRNKVQGRPPITIDLPR